MTAPDHRRRRQETSCIDEGIHTWAFEGPADAAENFRIGANGGPTGIRNLSTRYGPPAPPSAIFALAGGSDVEQGGT